MSSFHFVCSCSQPKMFVRVHSQRCQVSCGNVMYVCSCSHPKMPGFLRQCNVRLFVFARKDARFLEAMVMYACSCSQVSCGNVMMFVHVHTQICKVSCGNVMYVCSCSHPKMPAFLRQSNVGLQFVAQWPPHHTVVRSDSMSTETVHQLAGYWRRM